MMEAMGYVRTEVPNGIEYTLTPDPVDEFLQAEAKAKSYENIKQPAFKLGQEVFYTEVITGKHRDPEFNIWKARVVYICWDGEYQYSLTNFFDEEILGSLINEWDIHESQEEAVTYCIGYIKNYYEDKE
jgi:hypothetical protein